MSVLRRTRRSTLQIAVFCGVVIFGTTTQDHYAGRDSQRDMEFPRHCLKLQADTQTHTHTQIHTHTHISVTIKREVRKRNTHNVQMYRGCVAGGGDCAPPLPPEKIAVNCSKIEVKIAVFRNIPKWSLHRCCKVLVVSAWILFFPGVSAWLLLLPGGLWVNGNNSWWSTDGCWALGQHAQDMYAEQTQWKAIRSLS